MLVIVLTSPLGGARLRYGCSGFCLKEGTMLVGKQEMALAAVAVVVFGKLFNAGPDFARDGSQFDHLFKDDEAFAIGGLQAGLGAAVGFAVLLDFGAQLHQPLLVLAQPFSQLLQQYSNGGHLSGVGLEHSGPIAMALAVSQAAQSVLDGLPHAVELPLGVLGRQTDQPRTGQGLQAPGLGRQPLGGLEHAREVPGAGRAGGGRGAGGGAVPPPSSVVTPDEIASSTCWGQM